jgi:alpha-1,6-mannosyltransferase
VPSARPILRLWIALAGSLTLAVGVLVANRSRFDWAFELIDIPAVWFAGGLTLAGVLILPLPMLIERSASLDPRRQFVLLWFIVAVGIGLRAAMFLVNPVLEDDYYRYLWDGAVSARGWNPFAVAPATAMAAGADTAIGRLALDAGVVMDRINHPDLKTIYPPVAQSAFALAHAIKPWSIAAWRLVCLGGELASLGLLLALLQVTGQSRLWVAVYWWNPLIIKEMINSGHMEAVLMPWVLGAILLAIRRRPIAAATILGLAIGAKIWPILLAPLLLRPWLSTPRSLVIPGLILTAMTGIWVLPPYLGGLDETSGFVAFATHWQTNSALFPTLVTLANAVGAAVGMAGFDAAMPVRLLLGLIVIAAALWLAVNPWPDASALLGKTLVFTTVLYLLSPAQFPWYAAWMMPFLVFTSCWPLLALTALLPLYYASFHFFARDSYDIYRYGLVWLIWLPVWAGVAWHVLRSRGVSRWGRNA